MKHNNYKIIKDYREKKKDKLEGDLLEHIRDSHFHLKDKRKEKSLKLSRYLLC